MTPRTYQTSPRAERIRKHLTPLDARLLETLATVTYATTQQLQELTLPLEQDPARARRIPRRLAHLPDLPATARAPPPAGAGSFSCSADSPPTRAPRRPRGRLSASTQGRRVRRWLPRIDLDARAHRLCAQQPTHPPLRPPARPRARP